mmetsp:Transcript_47599/g.81900  ORF Transcript_47599/g.81900 Transcript_47599/m.81900 type:complete len:87 (-) Transcript_47599:29-289(-)
MEVLYYLISNQQTHSPLPINNQERAFKRPANNLVEGLRPLPSNKPEAPRRPPARLPVPLASGPVLAGRGRTQAGDRPTRPSLDGET